MKFRALNLDYHAEATLRLSEAKASRTESQKYVLLRAGCYETRQEEEVSAPHSRNSDYEQQRVKAQGYRWLESNAFVGEHVPRTRKENDDQCSEGSIMKLGEPTILTASTIKEFGKDEEQTSTAIARMREPMSCDDDADAVAATLIKTEEDQSMKLAAVSSKKQAKPSPRRLEAGELLRVLRSIQQETEILRLANEPWNDNIPKNSRPKQVPKLPFWREPAHFLPASVTTMDQAIYRMDRFTPKFVGPPRMDAIIRTLAFTLRMKDKPTSSIAHSFSFSMFGMLRDEMGDFALRRISREGCDAKLREERCAIVVYKGPGQHEQPPAQNLPAEWMYAVRLAMAALQYNVAVSTSSTGAADPVRNRKKRGAAVLENSEKPAGESNFADYLQLRQRKSASTLPAHQAGRPPLDAQSRRQSQVSFADLVPSNKASAEAGMNEPLPAGRENLHQVNADGEKHQDKDAKLHQKKKRKKERTKEERAARKKERKARKEKRRQEKKRKRREMGEEKTNESPKLAKKEHHSALVSRSNTDAKSPKRQNAHPRSVFSSRRVSVTSGDDELEKARNTLNHKARECRKAFSQMKLPRSTVISQIPRPNQYSQRPGLPLNMPPHLASSGTVKALSLQHPGRVPAGTEINTNGKHAMARTHQTLQAHPPSNSASNIFPGQQRPMSMPSCAPSHESQHQGAPSQPSNDGFSTMPQRCGGQRPIINAAGNIPSLKCQAQKPLLASSAKGVLCNGVARNNPISECVPSRTSTAEATTNCAPITIHNGPSQDRSQKPEQMGGRTLHQPIANKNQIGNHASNAQQNRVADQRHCQATRNDNLLPPINLLCSETFLEAWGPAVAELASGRWVSSPEDSAREMELPLESNSPKGRKINLIDTSLVGACGVDIESPGRCGYLVYAVSAFESVLEAKQIVKEVAVLAAIGRYTRLYIFLCYDVTITMPIAKHIVQLQCAVVSNNGLPPTKVCFGTATPASLSASLASSILGHPKSSPAGKFLEEEAIEAATNKRVQDRSRFLLSLLPVLSANGAIQCLLLAEKNLPPGSPYFRMLFQNQRLRQQIMLAATSNNGSEIHPNAMVQLSRVLRAFKDTDSQLRP